MLLARVEIEGFRAIRRLALELDPVTALIGENSYGKTSFLDALMICLGAGAEGSDFRFEHGDFHVPDESGAVPARRVRIALAFREAKPGDWDPPALAALAPAMAKQRRQRELSLEVVATRGGDDGPISVSSAFLDRSGRPLPAASPALVAELRRVSPALVVRANRFLGGPSEAPQPPMPAPKPAGIADEDARVRSLVDQIQWAYRRLAQGLRADELAQGVRAVEELALRVRDRLARVRTPPHRLLESLARAPSGLAPHEDAALPRLGGTAAQSVALLLLLGALLEARGERVLGYDAQPLVVIEDPEAHLHPLLLASLWRLIDRLPAQKIVTTNSGELLAAVPLESLRRLVRRPDAIHVHRLGERTLELDQLRRVAYHLRVNRAASIFARCWLLIEGETEFWLLPELARLLGYDFPAEGVRCVEFAQCGVAPLVKLADDLGIEWHLLADGDPAGQGYAAVARALAGRARAEERVTQLGEHDVEHCFWHHGFADVYRRVAGLPARTRAARPRARREKPAWVIDKAVRTVSKPRLALELVEVAARRGPDSVPPALRRLIDTTVRLARNAGS